MPSTPNYSTKLEQNHLIIKFLSQNIVSSELHLKYIYLSIKNSEVFTFS